jgi:hypothetical protein
MMIVTMLAEVRSDADPAPDPALRANATPEMANIP